MAPDLMFSTPTAETILCLLSYRPIVLSSYSDAILDGGSRYSMHTGKLDTSAETELEVSMLPMCIQTTGDVHIVLFRSALAG